MTNTDELREQIHEIVLPYSGERIDGELVRELVILFTQSHLALLERVEREVVGKNDVTPGGLGAYTTLAQTRRNDLRAEQRQALAKIKSTLKEKP